MGIKFQLEAEVEPLFMDPRPIISYTTSCCLPNDKQWWSKTSSHSGSLSPPGIGRGGCDFWSESRTLLQKAATHLGRTWEPTYMYKPQN